MIKSDNFCYRVVEEIDLNLLLKHRNDPLKRQFYREHRELTSEHQKKWWKDKVVNDDSWHYFVISSLINKEKVIGVTGIIYVDNINKVGESAYELWVPEYDNEECKSEILSTMTKYAFNDLNLNRVWVEVYEDKPLLDDYLSLGYKIEGTKRSVAYKDGVYVDSVICAMLKDEWNNE